MNATPALAWTGPPAPLADGQSPLPEPAFGCILAGVEGFAVGELVHKAPIP